MGLIFRPTWQAGMVMRALMANFVTEDSEMMYLFTQHNNNMQTEHKLFQLNIQMVTIYSPNIAALWERARRLYVEEEEYFSDDTEDVDINMGEYRLKDHGQDRRKQEVELNEKICELKKKR